MFYVYLLYSVNVHKYYVGSTNDINRRVKEHNQGRPKYTKQTSDWELVYFEEFEFEKEARKYERLIKKNKKYRMKFYDKARTHSLPV